MMSNEVQTLLFEAAACDYDVAMLEYLIEQGANVRAKDDYGRTPLHLAAKNNFSVIVLKYLVSQGASVHAKDEKKRMPLHLAAENNDFAMGG